MSLEKVPRDGGAAIWASNSASTVTLRAATTWHRHTDRVSGDAYHPIYLLLPVKERDTREQKHSM